MAGWFGRPVHLELRGPFELRMLKRSPLWRGEGVPAGEGRPLLIIPGFLAAPKGAVALHHILNKAGWQAEVASVGRNSGPAYVGLDAAETDLRRLEDTTGQPVTIVGHSRGGQFARVLAVRHPEFVKQIDVDRDRYADFPDDIDFVSIYSKTDGIVDWRTSIEPAAHTVEISASHRGLLNSVPGVAAIADALRRQGS
jgi:pimeloyl-ACP methyl ester carboxylesterase